MAKDKFHGAKRKQQLNEGTLPDDEKTLLQKGVSIQTEAMKTSMRLSDVEVTKEEIYDEFANRWTKAEQISDAYNIPDKRRIRILEKILGGPALPDSLIPLRPNNAGEAAYFMALRDIQDVVTVLTEVLFSEMSASEKARVEARIKEEGK